MKQTERRPPLGFHCTADIPHQPLQSSVVITLLAQGESTNRDAGLLSAVVCGAPLCCGVRGSPPLRAVGLLYAVGLPSAAGCGAPLYCGMRGSPLLWGEGLPSVVGCGDSPLLRGAGLPSAAGCGAPLYCGVRGSPPLRGVGAPLFTGCGPQWLPVGWSAGYGHVGFSRYSMPVWSGGSRAPEHRLGSGGTQV